MLGVGVWVEKYKEGLEWVYKYYKGECKEWGWKKESDCGPLLKEVLEVLEVEVEVKVKRKEAYEAKTQKAYVLPKENEKYKFEWIYSKYFWEGQVIGKEMSLEELEKKDLLFKKKTLP